MCYEEPDAEHTDEDGYTERMRIEAVDDELLPPQVM